MGCPVRILLGAWLAAVSVTALLNADDRASGKITLRVAGAQIPVGRDIAANVAAIERAIDYAAGAEADILVTPEGSLSGYVHDFDQAAVESGLERITRKARDAGLALALGTCFQDPAEQRPYDAVRLYNRNGSFLGFHAKILLCKRISDPRSTGEIDRFATRPLRTFTVNGLTVGALVCNDMWANPEWTPQDDPHLSHQLSKMGARVIFLSVNSGQAEGDELDLNRHFHEANLRIRARSGRQWIVVADACDPRGQLAGNAPSGVVDPSGKWVVRIDQPGEQFFSTRIEVDLQ